MDLVGYWIEYLVKKKKQQIYILHDIKFVSNHIIIFFLSRNRIIIDNAILTFESFYVMQCINGKRKFCWLENYYVQSNVYDPIK